jgi:hypothetical protein
MKKAVFLLLTTPIVWICVITLFPLIMIHIPYLGLNCGSLSCAAGSLEQFMIWTAFSLLMIGMIMGCAWESLHSSASRQKVLYIPQSYHNNNGQQQRGSIQSHIDPTQSSEKGGFHHAS